ncbi:MAG: hypothetical protein JXR83_17045, partial [Deltaproteobacteria bacterium]|nr:hypothetical protein [Deltaproteobacteria bacterium]
MLDALGLPDALGDMIGAQIDAARGDWAGYARNMQDLTGGMKSGDMDRLFGRGLPPSQFCPRPHEIMDKLRDLFGGGFHKGDISRERLGGKGPLGKAIGKALEAACMTDPVFKSNLEQMLGGRIILDGRVDGKVTVDRTKPQWGNVPFGGDIANNPMLSGIYGALSRLENMIKGVQQQQGSSSSTSGSSSKSGGTSGTGGTGGTGGANLDTNDPEIKELAQGMGIDMNNMSFEDIIFLMMMKYARKKEKEIISKMNELAGGGDKQGEGGSGGRRGYGGGMLGGIGQMAGGVLGGMVGGPIGSMIGSKVGGMAGNAIGGGGGASGSGGSGGAGGAEGAFGNPNQTSDTLKQMQMQKLMEDL